MLKPRGPKTPRIEEMALKFQLGSSYDFGKIPSSRGPGVSGKKEAGEA